MTFDTTKIFRVQALPTSLISAHHRQACKRKIARWATMYEDFDCGFDAEYMCTGDFVSGMANKAWADVGYWVLAKGDIDGRLERYLAEYGSDYREILGDVDIENVELPTWLHLEIIEYRAYIETII